MKTNLHTLLLIISVLLFIISFFIVPNHPFLLITIVIIFFVFVSIYSVRINLKSKLFIKTFSLFIICTIINLGISYIINDSISRKLFTSYKIDSSNISLNKDSIPGVIKIDTTYSNIIK